MNIVELLRRTFLEGYASRDIRITDIVLCLLATAFIAAYIFLFYRRINRDSFYNRNFNLSLLAIAVIIAAVILTIQSNIVVSLGMVGALSIVRFRTAVKDPMDLVFLFWSISVGIICGAGFSLIAVIASLVVSAIILCFSRVSFAKGAVVLLVNASDYEKEEAIMEVVREFCDSCRIKARNLTKDHLDLAVEISSSRQAELVKRLVEMQYVVSASVVSNDGDVTA